MGSKDFVSAEFYDTTSEVINTGGSIKTIYSSLIVYGVVIILAELVNALNNFLYLPFNQKVIGKLMQKVHLKISKSEPSNMKMRQLWTASTRPGWESIISSTWYFHLS